MRLAVYLDYPFQREGDAVYTERAFVLFVGELARRVDRLVMPGRLEPGPGRSLRSHYRVPEGIEFVPLPWYRTLAEPAKVASALWGSARRFWRVLDDVDAVWLLGPHPLGVPFALLAAIRRKRVFLGVRQDLPRYARAKHPRRRSIHLIADLLEGSYRALALVFPTIVVGPDLARRYRHGRRVLPISVSLVRDADVPAAEALPTRTWDGELTALSVGRLEAEKNPLLLADVLARLGPAWRLVICGEGPLENELRARLSQLGVEERAEVRGYVPLDGGLRQLYEGSHALLHVSWTEGVPQILFESFAAGLPVVATSVGGVAEAVGDDALLVPPGDPDAAAEALRRLAGDAELRDRLVRGGRRRLKLHTLDAETTKVAEFMQHARGRTHPFRVRAPQRGDRP
jgi:glycosyltransferase involved in cell wall biosynthesis